MFESPISKVDHRNSCCRLGETLTLSTTKFSSRSSFRPPASSTRLTNCSVQDFSEEHFPNDFSRFTLGKWWDNDPIGASNSTEMVGMEEEPGEMLFLREDSADEDDGRDGDVPKRLAWNRFDPQSKVNLKRRVVKRTASEEAMQLGLLASPQLAEESAAFPLLSSCLTPMPLSKKDRMWIEDNVEEIKYILGLPEEIKMAPGTSVPVEKLDELLFLAFMHKAQEGFSRNVKVAHSRLAYLGHYVIQLALTEFLLQRYPRELVASLRDRLGGMAVKKSYPFLLVSAGLGRHIYPNHTLRRVDRSTKLNTCKTVLSALVGAVYLTLGMPHVYRLLFEVLGMDPEDPSCQPRFQRFKDEDYVVPELDGDPITWRQVAEYKVPEDSLFANPRLFRACVPPGMQRFRSSNWMLTSLAPVLDSLGYPRPSPPSMSTLAKRARNEEMVLALQLAFMHPSLHKKHHPRFCQERLELLGSTVQDLVFAERLLTRFLDGPSLWLEQRHGSMLRNSACSRYTRQKGLDRHLVMSEEFSELFLSNYKVKNPCSCSLHHALHGVGYVVYGKAEVKRLTFGVFNLEEELPRRLFR